MRKQKKSSVETWRNLQNTHEANVRLALNPFQASEDRERNPGCPKSATLVILFVWKILRKMCLNFSTVSKVCQT